MNVARLRHGLLLSALLGAGWWAAGAVTASAWEQAGAAAAALFVARRWWLRPVIPEMAVADAAALALAAGGLVFGWAWPAALALALVVGRGESPGLARWRAVAPALLAVPWLATDAAAVGWLFRWTGAWAAGGVFDFAGMAVTRSGTGLVVEDQPLAVDAACAGLDTLQVTLVAGCWLADTLRTPRGWWLAVTALPLVAWLANTARIVMLGAVAVAAGHEAARGWFHEWGGLAVVTATFALAGLWAALLRKRERRAEAVS